MVYIKISKKKEKASALFIIKSIDFNPKEVNERLENGHFEVNTIEDKKSDINNISSMIDLKNSRLSMTLYKDKISKNFIKAIKINLKKLISP